MIFEYLAWTFLAVLFITAVVSYKRRKEHYKSLSKFPGPPPTFLIGNLWKVIRIYAKAKSLTSDPGAENTERNMSQAVLYEETGMHCVWYGPKPVVSIYKPEIVERVLRSGISSEKSYDYKFLQKWLGNGLFTSMGAKWKQRRNLLTPCFHFRILQDFLPVFNEKSFELIDKLKSLSDKEYIDMKPLMSLCSLDIVCETLMGVSIAAQKGDNLDYVQAYHDLGYIILQRMLRPWLWSDFMFGLTESGKQFSRLMEIVHNFTDNVIREKKEKLQSGVNLSQTTEECDHSKRRKAFLDLLLDMDANGQLLSDADIREEVGAFIFEGHDTSAGAATFALYCIGLYPEVQEKISEELNEIFEGDVDRPVTYEDIKKMKYLECVLKETLRLFPSVPVIGRRVREDIYFGDLKIPKNTTCNVNILALHRNSQIFPNPEIFDPERFLPQNVAGRHPYAFIPFSAGQRNCIGQKFAMLEVKTVVCNILRHLNVVSLDPRDKFRIKAEMVLRPTQEVRLKVLQKITNS